MKKIGMILFLAAFLLLALIPSLGMLVFGPAEAAANEILAFPPSVTGEDGSFNKSVLHDASDYLADHFFLRQQLVTADAKLEAGLLGESAAEDVVLGKEGWLYYAATLDDYRSQNLMTKRQIWAAARTLKLIQDYAAENGARMLFVIVPNKNEIYPEYMPGWALAGAEPDNREELNQALAFAGVDYLDLTPVLTAEKPTAQLYQTQDSHWNNLGAALAHDAILSGLGREGSAYDPAAFISRRDHVGDLYTMLYPTGTEKDLQYYPARDWQFQYTKKIRSPQDQTILTACESAEGSLLMFRDSFGNTLHSFMAESFAEASFSRAMPYNLQLLAGRNPDTLVIELVQRNLPWLAQRAPILPAPIRALDLSDAKAAAEISLTPGEEGSLFRLSGELPLDPEEDSPVWIEADGVLYEASPVGETQRSFTAYLPEPASLIRVCFRSGGTLYAAPCRIEIP